MLLASLLFTQVGGGYFHNKHDAHKHTNLLAAGEYAIQEHGEHCKLCAIDLIHLYSEPAAAIMVGHDAGTFFAVSIPGSPTAFPADLKGRSPPSTL